MDKRVLLIALLFAVVLVSGCVKINIRENISTTGMSNVSISLDLSAFPQQPGQDEENPCDQMIQDVQSGAQEIPMQNITCTYVDKILTISGQMDRSASSALTIQDGKYGFDIKEALTEFSSTESGGQSLPDATNEAQIEPLKAMGLEYNYYVKLPGTVSNQQGGVIQEDGSVKFDVLSLPEEAFVESTVAGAFAVDPLIMAGIAVAGLAIIVIVLLKRK